MATSSAVDAVVVGAGHNGLVAANYLLDAGLSVTVVEAAETVGGLASSGTPIAAAPEHVVNYGAGDLLFWNASPVATDLQLATYGLRTVAADPSYVYLHPDGSSLAIWRDPAKTAAEIRRFSPADATAYLQYAQMLDGLFDLVLPFMLGNLGHPDLATLRKLAGGSLRHRRLLGQFGAFAFAAGEEVIEERFTHPVVRATMHCLAAGAAPIDANGTSANLLILAFLHRVGASRPVGGMQAIPDALARRFVARGGDLRTSARVDEIELTAGRATGVRLVGGSSVRAATVLLTCDPRAGLVDLLPSGTLSQKLEARAARIPANVGGAGQMKVDLALSGRLTLSRHQAQRSDGLDLRKPVALIGTPESNRRAFARSGAGLLPRTDDIGLWGVLSTALDQSQAPDGQDSLYLYVPAVPVTPETDWKDLEAVAADAVVSRASDFYDGIDRLEIGRHVATPATFANEHYNATNGCVLHVDVTLLRSGPLRPALGLGRFALPVPGLYLGGAGAHPGGGVTGLPGRNAAREILRRRQSRFSRA